MSETTNSKVSVNDKVVFCGRLIGRVVRIKADGWVVVKDVEGRYDEYPLASLTRG